jgi:hypothetical protein
MPEPMAGYFEWFFQSKAPARTVPSWLLAPLDGMYRELLGIKERDERFEIYKRANEYIANEALWLFTVAPMGLHGVNKELEFVPQVAQLLYLDYSSVTENHWSLRGKNN